jgi:hypothetical protein
MIGETLVFLVEACIPNRLPGLMAAVAVLCSFVMNMAPFLPGPVLL